MLAVDADRLRYVVVPDHDLTPRGVMFQWEFKSPLGGRDDFPLRQTASKKVHTPHH